MIYDIHFIRMINSVTSNTNEKYLYLMKQIAFNIYESERMNQTICAQKYQVFLFYPHALQNSFTKWLW